MFTKKIEEEINNFMKSGLERQLAKKQPNVSTNEIFKFFLLKTFKKDDVQQKQFLQSLGLLVIKNHFCMHFVENS